MRSFDRLTSPALALLLATGAAACSSSGSSPGATATTTGRAGLATSTTTGSGAAGGPSSTAGATPGGEATSTTNPSAPTSAGAIVVSSPHAGQTVVSPLQVTGRSRVATVTIQLSDASGTVLAGAVVRPSGGQFSATMRFATTSPGPGTVTAFDTGPGGARQDIATVPVQLSD